ncbi:MAG: DNA recombination protein RmuC [Candidatus Gastranaerophilales bacterium]|nr:DNA recombination protein RmuC [Candidatus Gastranaerophilales bacterium]
MPYIEIIIGFVSFLIGFIIATIIFKKKNNDFAIYSMLNDFKNSIDEYKNQTMLNTKEINNAIKSASDLAKVLTTNQNLKGQFGEDCLEAILKACYPNENINYIKQYKTTNLQNKEIKPDFLIKLPNEKSILIDCKLNLEKYIEYQENPNLKSEFIKDLNATINLLSNKKYESATDLNQCGFILMYIPLEPILTEIYTDKDFISVIKNANEKNIIIVGNSSILTTIKLVKLLWAQDSQEKNIKNIIDIAQNIYEYISLHTQNLYKIKTILEQNTDNFNKEYEKLSSNNKLFKQIEDLRNYGIQTNSKKEGKKLNEIKIHQDFLN